MGVKIIANQKVVGCKLKKIFRSHNIVVLERFGREGIERLRSIAGCYGADQKNIESRPSILGTLSDINDNNPIGFRVNFFSNLLNWHFVQHKR